MLLGSKFQAFMDASPVSVMIRGTLERILHPETVEQLFADHAVSQYTLKITFGQCVHIMDAVVFKVEPSVGAWYQNNGHTLPATRQALYDKLKHVEPAVSAALVHHAGTELLRCAQKMKRAPKTLLPGYRLRVLDGNHLTGTEHRLKGLRGTRAAALPDQALPLIAGNDCVVADRNFCTTGFLFGLWRRGGYFVIRQHASTLTWTAIGKARRAGKDGQGRRLKEQRIRLTDPASGETIVVRRITIPLRKPNDKGEKELYVLTHLPAKKVSACLVADVYARRWTIETAFQQLTEDLRCEIDTLGYPRAALLGFCLACVAYNAVSLVKAAIRAIEGPEFVEGKLSMYYLTLEVARVTGGMEIAIPQKEWRIFRRMSQQEFLATIMDLASRLRPEKYTKHKRGPKKKPPKKTSGKRIHHVSTARILAGNR